MFVEVSFALDQPIAVVLDPFWLMFGIDTLKTTEGKLAAFAQADSKMRKTGRFLKEGTREIFDLTLYLQKAVCLNSEVSWQSFSNFTSQKELGSVCWIGASRKALAK